MAFADKIRFAETPESELIEREWAEQFKRLSGFDWPPRTSAEWTIVLKRAGFSQTRIEQFLESALGIAGFNAGELPVPYRSTGLCCFREPGAPPPTPSPDDDWPLFSVSLISGLESWHAAHPENHQASTGISSQFRTIAMSKRKAAKYLRNGNADSAVEWLNQCIEDGTIRCETLSRQSHVFDVRQFPENVRSQILPRSS